MKRIIGIVILFLLTTGCTNLKKYVPDHAFKKPIQGISIPHPEIIEQEGIKNITTFLVLMDAGLYVEVVEKRGVWPIIARLENGKEICSYIYLLGLSWKGDFLLKAEFPISREELEKAKILYFNRDAGFVYILDQPIEPIGYNSKKFQKKEKHREEVFNEHGRTLRDLENFWMNYCPAIECTNGYPIIDEIVVGSPEWIAYKELLYKITGHAYKDKFNGKIVLSHLEIEKMREIATQMPGFHMRGRWFKNWLLPIIGLGGINMAASVGTSITTSAIDASIKDDYEGYYARATVLRYELAPAFRDIVSQYKALIQRKNEIIYRQKILLEEN